MCSIICEVPVIGFFIFERIDKNDKYDFIPSAYFFQESNINTERKSLHLGSFAEPIIKRELSIEKISKLVNIKEEMCQLILSEIVKIMGQMMKQHKKIALDLKLDNGKYMVFSQRKGVEIQGKVSIVDSFSVGDASSIRTSVIAASEFKRNSQKRTLNEALHYG